MIRAGSRWFYSIRAKLLATILLLVAVATLLSLGGLHLFLEGVFRQRMEAEVSVLAEALKASLEQQMLHRQEELTQRTLEDVGDTGHVQRLLIVSPSGRVAHAHPASERGRIIDRASDPVCRNCHVGRTPPATRTSVTTDASGKRIFRMATPLVNQPRCHGCHDATVRFNGMLLIERSADAETEALGTVGQRLLATWVVTLGALVFVIFGITTAYVHRPVTRLIEAARRIGTGDLATRVVLPGRGELAELASTFNHMAASLADSVEEIRNKSSELSVLYSIVERLSKSIYLAELKPIVLEMVSEILGVPRVWMVSVTNEPDVMEVLGYPGASDRPDQHLIRSAEEFRKALPAAGQALADWTTGGLTHPRLDRDCGLIFLPLHFRERALALIVASTPVNPARTIHDERLLAAMCSHISVAMENARLYTLAITDELTQLYSLRHFQVSLEEEMNRFQRYGQPLAMLMLDLDCFKAVNDTYGHPAGDLILRQVAGRLRASVRVVDILCRYGGEEFAAILPHTDWQRACVVAERIRSAVAATFFDLGGGIRVAITVSIGVAACPRDATTLRDLVSLADQALYRAKWAGRNRVCSTDDAWSKAEKELQ